MTTFAPNTQRLIDYVQAFNGEIALIEDAYPGAEVRLDDSLVSEGLALIVSIAGVEINVANTEAGNLSFGDDEFGWVATLQSDDEFGDDLVSEPAESAAEAVEALLDEQSDY